MLIVVSNDLPPAVRGRMKLWFIEPKPNVFVSGVNDSVAEKVIQYLYKQCPAESGILIIRSLRYTPGYQIRTIGSPVKAMTRINDLQLVIESQKN